ncbi:MAG TPA: zinc ribbon domain-containing protein [Acidobacteriota bacterium]|jgi:putative FmdB family regulatory protein|nr:zinc ribbon domain-containing protein [Acidobacteriota bacterium]HNR39685.1 zinc ribbon domain-containing protein [Acidobacteriota bacterium]HNT99778.1 zinc ribbon domain-containing protein [Acidobacteriota bacterium]HPB27498.1 zinc ribbon domain-containing protein [Acidobacteriota bacterium]HQO24855.1 zinc ribbon domain-containing protein [Acidobacteriota bacterium]
MPLYEYFCRECRKSFEALRRLSDDDADVRCPHCGSEKVDREFSTFASAGSPGHAGCGPGPIG